MGTRLLQPPYPKGKPANSRLLRDGQADRSILMIVFILLAAAAVILAGFFLEDEVMEKYIRTVI